MNVPIEDLNPDFWGRYQLVFCQVSDGRIDATFRVVGES